MEHWLISLASAAFIVGIAAALAPEGKMRDVVTLIGSVVTIAVLLAPVGKLDFGLYEQYLADCERKIDEYTATFSRDGEVLLNEVISEQTSAYILDKTGIRASVTLRDGLPYSARLYAEYDATASAVISADLGIGAEHQTWGADTAVARMR